MSATLKIDMASFNDQIGRLQKANGKAPGECVRYWARILLKKFAYQTNISSRGFIRRGRLRAGWWPAAMALNSPTVYSGRYPNRGEGFAIDLTKMLSPKASFTMANTVPYGPYVVGLGAALSKGLSEVESRARGEFENLYRKHLKAYGAAGIIT